MEKKNKLDYISLISICVFLVLTIFEILAGKLLFKNGVTNGVYLIYALVQIAVLFIPAFIIFKQQKEPFGVFFKLRNLRLGWIAGTVFGALTATLGAAVINIILFSFPNAVDILTTQNNGFGEIDGLISFLAIVLIPALFEELLFHGAFLNIMRTKGVFRSVIMVALLFAMLHSSSANFLGALFAAVIYGYLTVVYDSLWPAVIAHFFNNLLSGPANRLIINYINIGLNGYVIFFALLLFFVFLAVFAALLLRYLKKKDSYSSEHIEKGSGRFSFVFLAFVALWIVKIVLKITHLI